MPLVIGDAGALAGALVAIMIVLAVAVVVAIMVEIAAWIGMPNWPLIGKTLYNGLVSIQNWVNHAEAWLWQHANPINIFLATTGWLANELSSLTGTVVYDIYSFAHRVITVSIPGVVNQAYGWYNDALRYASAEASAAAHVVYLQAYAWYNAGLSYTEGAVKTIDADIAAVDARVSGAVTGAVAAATAAAEGLVQSTEGWVLTQLDELGTTVIGEIETAVEGVQTDIGNAVRGVEQTLSPAITGAAAIGAAAAAAFETWRSECGDGLCSNLSQFGNIISTIEGLITDGALIALVIEAAVNPQGCVDTINEFAVQPAEQAISDVLGAVNFVLKAA